MPRDRRPDAVTVGGAGGGRLRALVVDDELPALEELSWLLRQDERIGEIRTAEQRRRRAAGARGRARRRGVLRHQRCPGSTAWTSPGCSPGSRTARRSCSSRPTTSTRSTPSTLRRRRLRHQAGAAPNGWPRRSAGSSEPAASRLSRRPPRHRGRDHPGRARRRHAVHLPQRRSATSRRRATTPGCTPATGSHLRADPARRALEERWGGSGFRAHPPQHAGGAAARRRGPHGRAAAARCVLGGAELQVSRRHTRELRDRLLRAPRPRTP